MKPNKDIMPLEYDYIYDYSNDNGILLVATIFIVFGIILVVIGVI